jgi:Ca-activated chloride channel family protein
MMPPKIHLERMMHRNVISVRGESAASYALIKLIPTGDGSGKPTGLNLALVLDVSGSMYEEDGTNISRLRRIQDAAINAIKCLQPTDTLSLVAFAHNAQLVLPPTPLSERAKIEDHINRIDMFDVDPGGTAMDQGMQIAIQALTQAVAPGKLNQLVVLTDGETSGEQVCRQLAQQLPQQKMSLTMMGVGTDWKAQLVKDLAKLGNGKWYYIDVENAQEAERVFQEEFQTLAAATFTNVQMKLFGMKDVKIKRCRLVVPEIKELQLQETGEREFAAQLGTLEKDKSTRYVLDLSLPPRPDGNFVVAQVEVTYEVGGRQDSTGRIPLQVGYSATSPGYVNAEVMKHIDEVQIYELNNNLQVAIQQNKTEEVQRIAESIEKKGELMGPRAAKKTMLAKQALMEINAGGRVSKKTMLALDDSMRQADELPN